MELTLIDPDASVQEQATAMADACETTGFFLLPLSAVDRSIADQAWQSAADFFALPEAEKRKVAFPEAGYPYGYSPFGYEALAKSFDDGAPSSPDLKESLSVGPDCGAARWLTEHEQDAATHGSSWIQSPSLWPKEPAGLRHAWEQYYRALADVAERLMSVMAVALHLESDYFAPVIDRPISSMRALHYPGLGADHSIAAGSLRAGAHSDYGTLTILRTDEVAGLEIRDDHGSWHAVAPRPDTFIVNLGDSIAQWTNDRWRSTVHRVAVTDRAPRQSFAFFHMANWDATIECLPTCREAGVEPRHKPVQAGPWLMRKFQSTVS